MTPPLSWLFWTVLVKIGLWFRIKLNFRMNLRFLMNLWPKFCLFGLFRPPFVHWKKIKNDESAFTRVAGATAAATKKHPSLLCSSWICRGFPSNAILQLNCTGLNKKVGARLGERLSHARLVLNKTVIFFLHSPVRTTVLYSLKCLLSLASRLGLALTSVQRSNTK